jgi:arginine deiminase
VELFARELFEASVIDSLIAVTLPRSRASIHLDAVLTMVDVDAFMVYPPVWDTLEAYVLRPSGRGVSTARADLPSVIAHTIGWKPRLIGGASDPEIARREQWNEAANLLAVAPGTVIANERNTRANASLREHGVEVLTVPASEIARGRGGPRCLTCPVARDSI